MALTGRSTLARALLWRNADIADQARFPARTIPAGPHPSALAVEGGLDVPDIGPHTRAFVVVHDDRIVFERYTAGPDTLETSFSIAKSFVSALVGIAIDHGAIGSATDPVTDYVPEPAAADPRFERITLADLLSMRSGLRYEESRRPWRDNTYTYYGVDLRKDALERSE